MRLVILFGLLLIAEGINPEAFAESLSSGEVIFILIICWAVAFDFTYLLFKQ